MNVAAALSDDLKSLYQEIILDHGRHPRNFRMIDESTCIAQGNNSMCGDKITVMAKVDSDGTLVDIAFEGKGCAISIASASMMTEALMGKPVNSVRRLSDVVQNLCTGTIDVEEAKAAVAEDMNEDIDKIASLSGVRQFPVRVKCATLAWHALNFCLAGKADATTEK